MCRFSKNLILLSVFLARIIKLCQSCASFFVIYLILSNIACFNTLRYYKDKISAAITLAASRQEQITARILICFDLFFLISASTPVV